MPTPHNPPAGVRRALRKLGADIHDARRRRRLPMAVVAERAFTSRSTLQRVEGGDTNVSIGIYAGVLQALGLLDGLINIADISNDSVRQSRTAQARPSQTQGRSLTRWLTSRLQITERILRDEETDEDLQLIFAPGCSLGGGRPKTSVIDQHGSLSTAKFPKETRDYSIETWEEIALRLASKAGIAPRNTN